MSTSKPTAPPVAEQVQFREIASQDELNQAKQVQFRRRFAMRGVEPQWIPMDEDARKAMQVCETFDDMNKSWEYREVIQ